MRQLLKERLKKSLAKNHWLPGPKISIQPIKELQGLQLPPAGAVGGHGARA